MAGLVLSREEVREVTGCSQRALQRQHLDALGIDYQVDANGWPKVDRRVYDRAMGVSPGEAAKQRREEATVDMGFLD